MDTFIAFRHGVQITFFIYLLRFIDGSTITLQCLLLPKVFLKIVPM
jgi:hypothetical protein